MLWLRLAYEAKLLTKKNSRMFVFAVPKLKEAFEGLGVELPFATRAIFGLADFLIELLFHKVFFPYMPKP